MVGIIIKLLGGCVLGVDYFNKNLNIVDVILYMYDCCICYMCISIKCSCYMCMLVVLIASI